MTRVDGRFDTNSLVDSDIGHDHGSGSGTAAVARPAPTRTVLALVRAYQLARSGRPTGCRYLPSCGPWGGHGIDPVPERSIP